MEDKKQPDQPTQLPNPAEETEKTKRWHDLSIIQALFLAIFISLLVVTLAVKLYISSDNQKYDINRPGSRYNSPKLTISENTDIDTSSPIDQQSLIQVNKVIEEQLKKLDAYSSYNDAALENPTLGLSKSKSKVESNY